MHANKKQQFEAKNSNTRNLKCLQAFMLQLDVGIWSGFKRKTELAESFLQPLVTVSRVLPSADPCSTC